MPAAFVQATNGNNGSGPTNATVTTTAFASDTTTGNAIIVVVSYDPSSNGNITNVTDSKGNTYAPVGSEFLDTNGNRTRHYYNLNITGGASHTVTANYPIGAAFVRIVAHEVSGLSKSNALDKDSGGNEQTSATPAASSVTTTSDGQYIFASVLNAGGTASETFSAGSGFIEPANSTAAAATNESMVEYQIQGSAGAIAAGFTRTGSGLCSTRVSTFRSFVPLINVQAFISGSGNWTKPPNANPSGCVRVILVGAGGSGGGGGEAATTVACSGGGGGGGGGRHEILFQTSDLGATEAYSVGSGSAGGGGGSAGSGSNGTAGGNSTFGGTTVAIHTAYGGGRGAGGSGSAVVGAGGGGGGMSGAGGDATTSTAGTAGANGGVAGATTNLGAGGGGGASSVAAGNAASAAPLVVLGGGGGGAGAGKTTGDAYAAGSAGGQAGLNTPGGSGGAASTGTAGSVGSPGDLGRCGAGGGGGGSSATTAGAGGAGGFPGGGGGGGGGAINAGTAAAGGAGANGIVIVITDLEGAR